MSRHGKYAPDTSRISVVISVADKETLKEIARKDRRTLSAFCELQLVKVAEAERSKTAEYAPVKVPASKPAAKKQKAS